MAEKEKLPDDDHSKDFFKTLSFYDDDPIDLPFESFFGTEDIPVTELGSPVAGDDVADRVLESVLETVVEQGVLPRKVATVHPFSLNNSGNVPPESKVGIRLAKFAVDPATSTPSPQGPPVMARPVLKLANFAVDPGVSSGPSSGPSSGGREGPGPPPLTQRPLFSPPVSCRSPQLPSLTRAPSPHANIAATPPPQSQAHNVACFGHFERELEYRYAFRTVDYNTHNGYIIFSSLDNVYIKLIVHETGLSVLPRDPNIWQSVGVKFINDQHSSWCFLTFRTKSPQEGNQQMTIQAELPMDLNHFSMLVQRKTNFVLSQTRVNALNSECLNTYRMGEISPSFYHVSKPKSYLRPNINNLGNECIDPNIRAEDRQKTVQWILTELKSRTARDLPGRASHIENRVYDRFAKQGQVLFRFVHQYYAEIRKEMNTFILQSRKEPQILELLDPQTLHSSQKSQHSPVRIPPGVTLEPQSSARVKQEPSAQTVSTSVVSVKREGQTPTGQQPFQSPGASYQHYPMSQHQQYHQMHFQQNAQNSQQILSQMERENHLQLQKMQKEREMRDQLIQKEREMQRMEEQRRLQREREQKILMEQQREREKQLLIQSQQRERERIVREKMAQERILQEQKKREQEQKFLELRRKQQEEQRMLMIQKQQEEQRRAMMQAQQEQILRQQQENLRRQKIQEENQRQAQIRQRQAQIQLRQQQEQLRQQEFHHQQEQLRHQQELHHQQEQLRQQQVLQQQHELHQQQFQPGSQQHSMVSDSSATHSSWPSPAQHQYQNDPIDQTETKYSSVLKNHEQQLNQTVEPVKMNDRQEVKFSTILEQQLSSSNQENFNEGAEENPYLRYTQYLSREQNDTDTATEPVAQQEPVGSESEVKFSHVLEQQEKKKREIEASGRLRQLLEEPEPQSMPSNVSESDDNNEMLSLPNLTIEPVMKSPTRIKQEPHTALSVPPDTEVLQVPHIPQDPHVPQVPQVLQVPQVPSTSQKPPSPSPPPPPPNVKLEKPDVAPPSSSAISPPRQVTPSLPSSISLRPIHTLMGPSRPETPQEIGVPQQTRPENMMIPSSPPIMMRPTRPQIMMRPTRPPMMMRASRPSMMMRPTRSQMLMRPTRPPMMMRPTRPQMMMRPSGPHMMMGLENSQLRTPLLRPPEVGHFGSQGLMRADVPSRLLSPNQFLAIRSASPTTVQVYLCPKCGEKFPTPESDPETQFKTNFSCHVLFNHLRAEVEAEMGCDDLEVCPADDCPYNIVQLKEDGVPDAESFLVKHYISRHLEVLMPLIHENPVYCHEACLKTIELPPSNVRPVAPKAAGLPNPKLKPIFLEKYFKFSRNIAKCPVPAECEPIHVVVFLNQWVSRRNYSIAGISTLVQWISEVHSMVDNKPLHLHPRLEEFINQMETRLIGLSALDNKPLIDTKRENEFYGDVITNPFDIIKATVCPLCNDKFQHTTKLLYHMLHLHKVNPVHFINKHLRAKPVRCNHCERPCVSPITFALHADQHQLKTAMTCKTCNKKYSSYIKYYTEDICGDNAIPKNVKMFVNNATKKLQHLEADSDIIGENFSNHFSKYAKRATINELPRDYRKLKKGRPKMKEKVASLTNVYQLYDHIPDTAEEWIINIPSMLDARISISVLDKEMSDAKLQQDFDWVYPNGDTEEITFEGNSPQKRAPDRLECPQCKKYFVTIYDLEQHEAIHRFKASSSFCLPASMSPRQKKTARLKGDLTTIICADCDGCSDDCDHSSHGIMLRQDSLADHVLRTGHQRCRPATEIRPETDCKVNMMSLAYSSVYGNKIRKLWKLLAKNDLLTSTSYEFANENKCKVKDCDFQAKSAMEIFRHIRENHLTEIKQLKIKIGKPPGSQKKISYRKPGPKSKTVFRSQSSNPLPSASQFQSSNGKMIEDEEMDFESAINNFSEMEQESGQEMIITHTEASLTLKADL